MGVSHLDIVRGGTRPVPVGRDDESAQRHHAVGSMPAEMCERGFTNLPVCKERRRIDGNRNARVDAVAPRQRIVVEETEGLAGLGPEREGL